VPRLEETEVPAAMAGMRLDRAASFLSGLARSEAAQLVEAGGVLIGGKPVLDRARQLKEGERIALDLSLVAERPARAEPVPSREVEFAVVYEDDDIVVIDKPAGLVVHPGAGNSAGTLVAGLLARYPELSGLPESGAGTPERPGIVHRLDKETSGLLVVARSVASYQSLVLQLKDRRVSRRYRAVLLGQLAADAGVVDAPIGRSESEPTKMAVSSGGKLARTHYAVLERFSRPLETSYVDVRLETGRTHQIRVHMAAIGHPVLGDPRYGGRRGALAVARPMLHAASLSFEHPTKGEEMSFSSPLPADFEQVLARLS
jgi:23S rRNA pseudouridine1911/1915/1917 synthase